MKLIFYDEAANLLGVSQDVLRQAASRGDLTRAGTEGNRQRLIKEQVMLFVGTNPRTGHKKRISQNALTEQERALWNKYASELRQVGVSGSLDIEQIVSEKVREELARQEYARIAEQERALAKRKEGLLPFLSRQMVPA